MKNLLISFAVVVAACVTAFGVVYAVCDNRAMHAAAREGNAMTWLRVEFQLNDTQFAAVKQLHDDYSAVCSKHCRAILAARERQAPAAEVAALESTCVHAMMAHFRQVAALLPPGQGKRYLAMVLPRIAGYSHHGAPDLRVTP